MTHRVIDILARHDVRSTFFVLGQKLADPAARDVAERAHAAGHWVGNHSFTHKTPLGRMRDAAESVAEISRTQEAMGALAHPRRFFRPFGGGGALGPHLLSRAAFDHLCAEQYTCVLWNAIPRDWEGDRNWVQRAIDLCAGQDWTLIVLHDLPTGAMQYLHEFLCRLEDNGFDIEQDFPPECLIVRNGVPDRDAEKYISG